jgi:predicted metal-dependent TIM-barrel fold hydrolase
MKLFDPHIHMTSGPRRLRSHGGAGIAAVVEPSFWMGQPRTHVGSFEDYCVATGLGAFRASQFGIRHSVRSLNPKEANSARIAQGVIDLLPRYLSKDGVVAVGEIGYDDMTPEEDKYFAAQLELAIRFELPVLIHTPHRDKKRGTERTLALIRDVGFPEERALVDHNTEETLPLVLATACWAGHSIYPFTKMDEPRMVALVKRYGSDRILVNSAADWGVSDPLKVPKTAALMRESGISEADIDRIVWQNPVAFFSQSGRLDLGPAADSPAIDQTQLWEGNSVLRGQQPIVKRADVRIMHGPSPCSSSA